MTILTDEQIIENWNIRQESPDRLEKLAEAENINAGILGLSRQPLNRRSGHDIAVRKGDLTRMSQQWVAVMAEVTKCDAFAVIGKDANNVTNNEIIRINALTGLNMSLSSLGLIVAFSFNRKNSKDAGVQAAKVNLFTTNGDITWSEIKEVRHDNGSFTVAPANDFPIIEEVDTRNVLTQLTTEQVLAINAAPTNETTEEKIERITGIVGEDQVEKYLDSEEIERLHHTFEVEPITTREYHVLTPSGRAEDLLGNIVLKTRTYSLIPLEYEIAVKLEENRHDIAPSDEMSFDQFISQFPDDTIKDINGNRLQSKPITIFADGSTSMENSGVFDEQVAVNERKQAILDEMEDQLSIFENQISDPSLNLNTSNRTPEEIELIRNNQDLVERFEAELSNPNSSIATTVRSSNKSIIDEIIDFIRRILS